MFYITVKDVSYVERLGHNLFSFGKFCDKDLEVNFNKHKCVVRTKEGNELLVGHRNSNLFTIKLEHMKPTSLVCLLVQILLYPRLKEVEIIFKSKKVKDGSQRCQSQELKSKSKKEGNRIVNVVNIEISLLICKSRV